MQFKHSEQGLKLANTCISYDFLGAGQDDTADEPTTVQVPTNWRSVITDHSLLDLFFQLYSFEKPNISRAAIDFMV